MTRAFILGLMLSAAATAQAQPLLLTNGLIVDGSGTTPYIGWLAMDADRITAMGKGAAPALPGAAVRDVGGQAIAPGFVNMLSWATESLLVDGRALSDLKQGITLEVMGEGESMGPWNDAMKALDARRQGDIKYTATWTSLGDYLNHLEQRGIAVNVASFVGAATVRVHELGENNVQPTPAQLARMQGLVRAAMHEGAMGVGSSLIYTPGNYAKTAELTALMQAAAPCGGMYISHIRNEGPTLEAALEEIISIAKDSGARAEIYHMKQAGRASWGKYDAMVARIEAARAAGVALTADMYTYAASSTGLDASMPLWVQEGGIEAWTARMKDPAMRARVIADMRNPPAGETNSMAEAGGPDKVLLLGFKTEALKALTGKTLAEVAASRGTSAEDTAIDLVIADGSRIQVAYFSMNEANVKKQIALPWMSFASDASAQAPEGVFLKSSTHPRAYGNFARVLGKYVREEKVISLAEAVRKLSAQPADNLRITARGRLKPGNFADVVVFDPATIADRATFAQPQQLAVGVNHVWVNGVQVLQGGEPTGAAAGRFVKGPGTGRCPA
ncbi:amidohydrolase family protein [Sandarakinorhabdus sp.]|uniref:N-acyl-D-amino-acid deacylase family protein n=1 Tax=Sandarakinorhabdus sp. TaxID=1916663 RepID=UPI00333E1F34